MQEKEVEQYLNKRVKNDLRGLSLKFVSPGFNGVPDRIILIPGGRVYFVETKAPGKTMRKLQKWVCGQIESLGFAVLTIDTKQKADVFVKELCEGGI